MVDFLGHWLGEGDREGRVGRVQTSGEERSAVAKNSRVLHPVFSRRQMDQVQGRAYALTCGGHLGGRAGELLCSQQREAMGSCHPTQQRLSTLIFFPFIFFWAMWFVIEWGSWRRQPRLLKVPILRQEIRNSGC